MLALALGVGGPAHGDEGGVAFWFSGQYASLAAVPATPGWSLPMVGYYYSGSASAGEVLPRGDSVTVGLNSRLPLLLVQPTYAPERKVLGGQAAIGLGFGYGRNSTATDLRMSPRGTAFDVEDSVSGFTDLYPVASLAWNDGVHNWMTYLTGDIPVGAYDSKRLANIGIGHAAIDAGGGYTYLDQKSGREFSAVLGVTYNWENKDTQYQNGIDSHLDWAASQFLSANWQLGVAGYVYYQLTGDSGAGAKLGPFKSKVAAIGPEIGYVFSIGGLPAYANLRGYWEFEARNRLEGYAVFVNLVLPLGH
ncbi:MAG TPA: transporter [Burkholderiaceae bacterium]|nr:transporter [Burkholderiaceae bacterium]